MSSSIREAILWLRWWVGVFCHHKSNHTLEPSTQAFLGCRVRKALQRIAFQGTAGHNTAGHWILAVECTTRERPPPGRWNMWPSFSALPGWMRMSLISQNLATSGRHLLMLKCRMANFSDGLLHSINPVSEGVSLTHLSISPYDRDRYVLLPMARHVRCCSAGIQHRS